MNLKNIIPIVLVLVAIGFTWFVIKKLFFWALVAGGAYVAYKLFVSDKKQIES